jgi:hypothetical protein
VAVGNGADVWQLLDVALFYIFFSISISPYWNINENDTFSYVKNTKNHRYALFAAAGWT